MSHASGVPVPLTAGALATGPGELLGITVHATGTTPKIRLWDNTSASGTLVGTYELTTSGVGSTFDVMYSPARQFTKGLFLEVVTGTVEGSVFI